MMDELLKKLATKGQPKMSEQEVQAKMEVVKELLEMAQSAMADGVKGDMDSMMAPKSVEVSAPDKESLSEGLDMAKDLIESKEADASKDDDSELELSPESEMADAQSCEDDEDEEDKGKKFKKSFPSLL